MIFNKKNFILICLIIILSATTITYGRYVYNEIRDFYLSSKSFYFNSDKLMVNRAIYRVDNWSAVDPYLISINLNNSKNNLLRSNSDIEYIIEYSCSSNVECQVNKEDGTLYTTMTSENIVASISPKMTLNDGDEAWIEIVAKSTYPYKKTLSGRFILKVGKIGLSYSIDDLKNRPYFDFRITNTIDYYTVKEIFDDYQVGDKIDRLTYINLSSVNKSKCTSALITLKFDPNKVILDMTNTAYLKALNYTTISTNGYDYVNSITFKIDSESSESVRFYKADTSLDYTYPITNDDSIVEFYYSA